MTENANTEVSAGLGAQEVVSEYRIGLDAFKIDTGTDLKKLLRAIEFEWVMKALTCYGNNKAKAAEFLGLNRTTLVEKCRKFGLVVAKGKG